jgi:cyanophycin synthetase
MRIESSRRLRGPNRYLSRPVQVSRVRLDELTEKESTDFPGFTDRLLAAYPGLADHHCAAGRPGGFVARLREGTYFGHIAEHVAIELSCRIGREVSFGRTTYAGEPGCYDVATECPVDEPDDSTLPEALLALAIDATTGLLRCRMPDHGTTLDALRRQYTMERPGPSTAAIAEAARRRGIPVERAGSLSLLRLGHGRHRRLVWAAMTDQTSAVAVDIAGDKELTRQLLADAGVAVPLGGAAATVEAALALLAELGPPVVVKPRHGRQGQHVFLGVDTPDALRAAFAAATADGGEVVVEQQLPGKDFRVLVIAGRIIAAAERVAAHVTGDGVSDLAALIERANADPLRGHGHERPLTRLAVDDVAETLLRRQGLALAAVPERGRVVWLRDNANLSTGGTSVDVTDLVHPDVTELCHRVAALVGLDVAGLDLRLPDIAAPPPPTEVGARPEAGVIEVNAAPGLRMHLASRDAGAAIVEALYPAGTPSRVPTVSVTGTNGKTTVARLTAHLLSGAGLRVGLTTTDGVYIGGRLIQRADATGPRSAQMVLGDPTIDAAVLETARGGLLRQGLGYDWSDVGIVTNVTEDHLGQDGIDDLEDLVDVKSLVAERVRAGGTVVLNADDPRCRGIAERLTGRELVWFGLDPHNPVVRRHWDAGGRAYLLADGWLVELAERRWVPLLAARDLAGGFWGAMAGPTQAKPHRAGLGGALAGPIQAEPHRAGLGGALAGPIQAEPHRAGLGGALAGPIWAKPHRASLGVVAPHAMANALAAVAAARDLGVTAARVAERLRTFTDNPGRGSLHRVGEVDVLVDYAHNPAAIAAISELVHRVWGCERAVAAVTLPGDRRDELLRESARVIAERFDRVVLYEDSDLRGRAPGEVPALVRAELTGRVSTVSTVEEAVPAALAMARPGDVVLLLYEKIEPVLALLEVLADTRVELMV